MGLPLDFNTLTSLQNAVQKLNADPNLLHQPVQNTHTQSRRLKHHVVNRPSVAQNMAFFRAYLVQMGATIPAKKEETAEPKKSAGGPTKVRPAQDFPCSAASRSHVCSIE